MFKKYIHIFYIYFKRRNDTLEIHDFTVLDNHCVKKRCAVRFGSKHYIIVIAKVTKENSQGNPAIAVYDYILRLQYTRSLLAFNVRQFSLYYNAQRTDHFRSKISSITYCLGFHLRFDLRK